MSRLFPMLFILVLTVPTWSESILFLQSGDGMNTEEMAIMDTDGGNVLRLLSERLATQFYKHYEHGWSPDDNRRAAVQTMDGELNIYITAVDGSADKNVTNHNAWYSEVAWSPDGDRIAFVSDREASPPGDIDVFILELDNSNLIRIQGKPGPDANPAWSWDGERLAFSGVLPEERRNNHEI